MGKKKTHEQFLKEVFNLVGKDYEVLGTYKGAKTKIKMRHIKCGNEYEVRPDCFLKGSSCPKCSKELVSKKNTKTTEKFKKEVFDLVGEEYIVLGDYKTTNTKIKMKHNKCGHEYLTIPNNFLQGTRCPICWVNALKTTEQFKKEVYNLVGDEYTVLENYKGSKTKILMRHNKCGHEYLVTPNDFLHSRRCPKCFGTPKKTTEQFKQEVFKLLGDEYTVLGEYKNANTKIKMRHEKCGYEWEIKPNDFLNRHGCPKCRSSKGEVAIMKYLEKRKIPFNYEHSFKDLIDVGKLRFDFYLPDHNICIEYDGGQHFKPVTFGGMSQEKAEENFKSCQRRDKIKDEYCKKKGIRLIRIPYTEFKNIKKILKGEIK